MCNFARNKVSKTYYPSMMATEETEKIYNSLRCQVEHLIGLELKIRRHFDMLAETVFTQTRNMISPTTLRRFWGYQETSVSVSRHTLDVLSMFVGCRDWDDFKLHSEQQAEGEESSRSGFLLDVRKVRSEALDCGQQVVITWLPDRRVVVVHEGTDVFRVVSNENSKLRPGDTFHCVQLVEGQPLFCTDLLRNGHAPMSYVGGKKGGIKFILQ